MAVEKDILLQRRRKPPAELPDGFSMPMYFTFKTAAAVTGIPEKTLRNWKDRPGSGFPFGHVKNTNRILLPAKKLIRWLNLNYEEKQ